MKRRGDSPPTPGGAETVPLEVGQRPAPPRAPAAPARAAFRVGQRVAGRFRITRFLARGGMGEVYAARDLELNEEIALKTLRAEIAGDERALERLRSEVQLARRVTHSGVCRLFDLGLHPRRGATPIPFLTMELLDGERLDQRLAREGNLDEEAALPIAREVLAALAAAHAAGVVHRDLKPENILLAARVVVTDFGIAAPVGAAGASWGSPLYLAPEVREGREVGPAADLFSFGIVLFEMLIGERPPLDDRDRFEAGLATLTSRVAATLRHCLAEGEEARPSSADEVALALAPPAAPLGAARPESPAGASDRGWLAARLDSGARPLDLDAAAAVDEGLRELAALRPEAALGHFDQAIERAPNTALAHSGRAEALSSLGFSTRAAEAARQAFLLSGELGRRERLEVEARYRRLAAEWTRAIELQRTLALFDPESVELKLELAAIQLDAGQTKDALETIEELRTLDREEDPRIALLEAEQAWLASETTRQCEIATHAIELATLRGELRLEARGHFLLATALFHLGRFDESEAQFNRARELFRGDAQGTAVNLFSLGVLLRSRGRVEEAKALYEEAHAIAQAHGQRRHAANAVSNLAGIYMARGDAATARRFCEEAIAGHRELGNLRSLVRTLTLYAIVISTEGDFPGALAAYREAIDLGRELGDPLSTLTALQNLANACATWGRQAEAHLRAEEARQLAEAAGDPVQIAHSRVFGAFALVAWGRLAEAEREVEAALAVFAEVGDRVRLASARLSHGQIALLRGDLEAARARYEQSREEAVAIARPQFTGWALAGLGEVALWARDLSEARAQAEESLRLRIELNEEWSLLGSYYLLAQIELADGRPRECLSLAQESRERAARFGRKDDLALAASLASLAHLSLERIDEAEADLASARTALALSESDVVRAWVELRGAEVGLAAGRRAEAREMAERVHAFAQRSGILLAAREAERLLSR
ncbi:MAG: tetratricopeptide repeat protein [Candidatus Eisenbacteria bacterium]